MAKESSIRKNGAVYTPQGLSQYLAQKTVQYVFADPAFRASETISVVDPASGDGMLLRAIEGILSNKKELKHITLCGVDIDAKAIASCEQRLESINEMAELHLIHTNALCPFGKPTLLAGWDVIFEEASVDGGFDILIANPPWGADLSEYKNKLDAEQYTTLQGQVDSFELFLELAIRVVKTGGYFAFIVPDSILNHGKSAIRNILITSTQIKSIARLGEKIFPGINRACAIVICKKMPPSGNNLVDCFRLSSKDRAMILAGDLSFSDAELASAHEVPQKRFANSPYKQFSVDLRENETMVLAKLRKGSRTLSDALSCTRGVELGSSGMICVCNECGTWAPLSKKESVECPSCGSKYDPRAAEKNSIVSQKRAPNSVSLITGGDLKRYRCSPSKWIVLGKKGINYKPRSVYETPKILIRKTGVGLTAAIDYSSAYTNQVVYILRSKQESDSGLEFFISLINSRAYYFFLVKSFGELEWRSHPYLTQSQILSLPLPDLESEKNKIIVNKIVSMLRPILKKGKPSKQIDLEIELLIGELFSLTRRDYEVIFNAIDESDELLPIRELKGLKLEEILERLSE